MKNLYTTIKNIIIRLQGVEKVIEKGDISTNISFSINENGHLIQNNN